MKSLIESAYSIASRLDESLNGIKLRNEEKYIVAASFFSLSLEHHRSTVVLIENGLYGSASTLLRSLFESYIRGIWFFYCSSEKDIEKLRKDKFELSFGKLIEGIEKECGEGVSRAKKESWNALNSLTHSGAAQVNRRSSNTEIQSNYSEEFLRDALKFANNYALLSGGELAKISGNLVVQNCTLKIAEELGLL